MSKLGQSPRRVAFLGLAIASSIFASPSVGLGNVSNQLPSAQDDVIVARVDRDAVTLATLLSNDTDPEGSTLSIVGVVSGSGGSVTLDPAKPQQVVFKPNSSFTGLYTFTYEVADSSGARATATVTVRNPFRQAKGVYAGAISGAEVVPNSFGYVTLTLSSNGSFSAQLRFAGEVLRFKGVFDLDGTFSSDFPLSVTERRRVQLTLPVNGGLGPVTGMYSGGDQTIQLSLPLMTFTRSEPPPFSGQFTVAFPAPDSEKATPGGIGYGILRVSETGNVLLSGKLGDSSTLSFRGYVNPDGTVPIYNALYKGRGGLAGQFSFLDGEFVRVNGSFDWFKPRIRSDRSYPNGFNKNLEADGAEYTAPSTGSYPLDVLPHEPGLFNTDAFFHGGGFNSLTQIISLPPRPTSGRYEIVPPQPNGLKFSGRIDPRNGYFIGTVRTPKSKELRRFSGVLIQGINQGVGVVAGGKKTGSVELISASVAE